MTSMKEVMNQARLGAWWRAPDLSEKQVRGYDTGAEPVHFAYGSIHIMAGEPQVLWDDGSKTTLRELANPDGGWEPISDDAAPVEPPPPGTKRWYEEMARRHTGVAATASHLRPGAILIELAEPPACDVGILIELLLCSRVRVEVRWADTKEMI